MEETTKLLTKNEVDQYIKRSLEKEEQKLSQRRHNLIYQRRQIEEKISKQNKLIKEKNIRESQLCKKLSESKEASNNLFKKVSELEAEISKIKKVITQHYGPNTLENILYLVASL